MKNNKLSKLNWLNVILNEEFQSYLDMNTLKELSSASKLIRFKLIPRLFHCVKLQRFTSFSTRWFKKNEDRIELCELARSVSSKEKKSLRDLFFPKILGSLVFGSSNINRFISSLNLAYLDFHGYYLFEIFKNFNNLTILKLKDCITAYSNITNLGKLYPKLENVELDEVLLVKLVTDSDASKDFIFPSNLKSLYISDVDVTEKDDLFDPCKSSLFDVHDARSYRFKLPKISITSLKKLSYMDPYKYSKDIEQFLIVNPNLESLSLKYFYFSKVYNFKSLIFLETDYLYNFNNEFNLPIQENIKQFRGVYEYEDYKIPKLINLMPNLEKLNLYINVSRIHLQLSFNKFLLPYCSNLPNLKSLYLEIDIRKYCLLDINEFHYIENIVFELHGTGMLNVEFEDCKNLKYVGFKLVEYDFDEEIRRFIILHNKGRLLGKYKELYDNIDNWRFYYYMGSIKGYKLS
jgi:hypothetical protein